MGKFDPSSSSQVLLAVPTGTVTAGTPLNGTAIDTNGWDLVEFVLVVGTNTVTGALGFTVQSSPNGVDTWTDVTGASVGVLNDGDDDVTISGTISSNVHGRYLRMEVAGQGSGTATVTGTANLHNPVRTEINPDPGFVAV
jgi:hypothetical protein